MFIKLNILNYISPEIKINLRRSNTFKKYFHLHKWLRRNFWLVVQSLVRVCLSHIGGPGLVLGSHCWWDLPAKADCGKLRQFLRQICSCHTGVMDSVLGLRLWPLPSLGHSPALAGIWGVYSFPHFQSEWVSICVCVCVCLPFRKNKNKSLKVNWWLDRRGSFSRQNYPLACTYFTNIFVPDFWLYLTT